MEQKPTDIKQAFKALSKEDQSEFITLITPRAAYSGCNDLAMKALSRIITPEFAERFYSVDPESDFFVDDLTPKGEYNSNTPKRYHTVNFAFHAMVENALEDYYLSDLQRWFIPGDGCYSANLWDREYLYEVLQWGFERGAWKPKSKRRAKPAVKE